MASPAGMSVPPSRPRLGERWGLPALGLTLPQFKEEPAAAVEAAATAARLGYCAGFVFDHLWPLNGARAAPVLEAWTLLGAFAGALHPNDGGFRLGTLVTRVGLRPPVLLKRMAAAVSAAAGASAIVGIGTGDSGNRAENEAYGLAFGTVQERLELLAHTAEILRDPPHSAEVWVGGNSARIRQVAAALDVAWNSWGLSAPVLAAGLEDIRCVREGAGQDPQTARATWGGQVLMAPSMAQARRELERWGRDRSAGEVQATLWGDPAAIVEQLHQLGEAGANWTVLAPVGPFHAETPAALASACATPAPTV